MMQFFPMLSITVLYESSLYLFNMTTKKENGMKGSTTKVLEGHFPWNFLRNFSEISVEILQNIEYSIEISMKISEEISTEISEEIFGNFHGKWPSRAFVLNSPAFQIVMIGMHNKEQFLGYCRCIFLNLISGPHHFPKL